VAGESTGNTETGNDGLKYAVVPHADINVLTHKQSSIVLTLDSGRVCEFSFRLQRSVIHLNFEALVDDAPHGHTRSTTVTSRLCQL
jgi:hypothetical protein